MMRLTIPVLAIIVIAVVVMTRWPSTSSGIAVGTAAMPSLQELHVMAGVHKLPLQEIDDQAMVYSSQGKR